MKMNKKYLVLSLITTIAVMGMSFGNFGAERIVFAQSAGNLVCSPATQNVILGQTATYTVTGGNGVYLWTAPDLTIADHTGSGFRANYASTGLKTLTVSSNGLSTTCLTNVLSSGNTTPSFPDTGFGIGE